MNHPDRIQLTSWQRDELHGVDRGGCDPAIALFILGCVLAGCFILVMARCL